MGKINRLRSVKLDEISFVGKGDNPEANILLLKMKSDEKGFGIVALGKECKGKAQLDVLKKWLADNPTLVVKEDGDALTFAEVQDNRELREKVWNMCWTLEDSLGSIMRDDTVTDKTAMIATSIDQFKAAITAITKGEPIMSVELKKQLDEAQAKVTALEKQVEDVTKENETLKADCSAKDKKVEEMAAQMKKEEGEDPIYKGLPEAVVKELKDGKERIAKMEDNELTRTYVAKAAEVVLVGKADEIGDLLKKIAKTDSASADKVFELFKTANARIQEGNLLKESGDNTNTGVATAYEKIVAKAAELRKSHPEMTEAKAFTKVYDEEHELRAQYEEERNA